MAASGGTLVEESPEDDGYFFAEEEFKIVSADNQKRHDRYQAIFTKDAEWLTVSSELIPSEYVGSLICLNFTDREAMYSESMFGHVRQRLTYSDGVSIYKFDPIVHNIWIVPTMLRPDSRISLKIRVPSIGEVSQLDTIIDPLYCNGEIHVLPVKLHVEVEEIKIDWPCPH